MSKFKVCVSDARHADYDIETAILNEIDAEIVICDCVTAQDIVEQCGDADGILLDMAPMTREAIAGLKNCKVINRYGVGYNNVDVEAATEAGIQLTYVPDYCMEDVSDHAIALLLACLRQIPMRDRRVRGGEWNIKGTSYRLKDHTLGVVGAGRIARCLIRKVSGFGLKEIVAYDPYISKEDLELIGARKVELDELLEISDFVSLHSPVTPETTGMIGEAAIAKMKPTAILINASRGPLVDDKALLKALKEGRLLGAGLDTHNKEPLGTDSPFCELDNVVLTDHTAYGTVEGIEELKRKSAENVADVLMGRESRYPINHV